MRGFRPALHSAVIGRLLAAALLVVGALGISAAQKTAGHGVDASLLEGLHWRSVGPAVFGGRVVDVAGVPGNPNIIYVAHSSAGLFKSTNGGITMESIFNDGNTLSIGAIAVSPDNPNVVYVGTGEGTVRNSASFGDGIYKTMDGGATWKHLGLTDSERFSRIAVNPLHTEIVFAAAMGHEWGPNKERGLYRSTDGGNSWKQVLFVNETTGASDVALDPANPNVIYAGMYDYMRQPWHFRGGGPGGGLYKSSDGGDTWVKLNDPALHNGLPGGIVGRVQTSISRSNPNVVYSMIESREGLLWRSDDAGAHWRMASNDRRINPRPFYFSFVKVDPTDENRIYCMAPDPMVSEDGGKNFRAIDYWKMFGDAHILWIDPTNPSRLLAGSDGGLFISNDRGANWDFINNTPMAQAYHVAVDMEDPYNILGGFQDHEMWRGPNERWNETGVRGADWRRLRSHADGEFIVADPRDSNVIYYVGQGDMTRFDMRTHEERYIQPYPVGNAGTGDNMLKYRFNWNPPILMSRHNPDVIYHAAQVVFKTTDGGYSWKAISPDLTTNNPKEEELSGGSITPDNSTAEFHCTIVSLAESASDPKTLWAGTDDGNLQVTRNGGESWTNEAGNITGLPPESWVSSINTSYTEPGTVYVSFDRHQMNDFAAYAYITRDYGRTWKRISAGLGGYVHIIAGDPKQPHLLYAGTELGLYASFDDGENWTDLRLDLPHLPVYDLVVHPRDNDLIIATHARGFYVLDDATPLQQLAEAIDCAARDQKVTLFPPTRGTRYNIWSDTSTLSDRVWVARNKPYGSIISYYLAEAPPENTVNLSILDSSGRTLRTFTGPGAAGVNRTSWNLREDPRLDAVRDWQKAWNAPRLQGVRVLSGKYKVRLEALGETEEQEFAVRLDPNVHPTQDDMAKLYDASKRLVAMEYSIDAALERIQRLDDHLDDFAKATPNSDFAKKAEDIRRNLDAVRTDLMPPRYDPEHLNLSIHVRELEEQVSNYSGRPTMPQEEYIGVFGDQLHQVLQRLDGIVEKQLKPFNEQLAAAHVPNISPEDELDVAAGSGGK
jgi:photosystem II stability/assembly factor-like uncharacterized protein